MLRGQPKEAARFLGRSVRVGDGAAYETESRWLLGAALEQAGQVDAAKKEWAKLVRLGLDDDFVKKAKMKLLAAIPKP